MPEVSPPALDAALAHTGFVQGLARALMGADRAVDDVVQDTWLAAARSGPRDPARMKGWLGGVVRRLAAGVYRKRATESRLNVHARVGSQAPSTAEVVAKEEIRREVVEGMLRLGEPYRSALLLRYYEDLPPRRVAERLQVPVETARTQVKRGLAKLRGELDQRPGGRGAWMPLVGGLAGVPPKAGAGIALGVIAVAALVVAAIGAGLWWALDDDTQPPPAGGDLVGGLDVAPDVAGGRDAQANLEGRGVAGVGSTRELPKGTARIVGFIRGSGIAREAGISLWHVGRMRNDFAGRQDAGRHEGVVLTRPADGHTVADLRGHFRFKGLGVGTYVLGMAAPGGDMQTRLVFISTDGLTVDGSLRVPTGAEQLTVHCVHGDGTPYVGPFALHLRDDEKGDTARLNVMVETDAKGHVSFESLPSGAVWYEVRGEGFKTTGSIRVPQSQPVTVIVGRSNRTLRASVVSAADGTPVANAVVRITTQSLPEGAFGPLYESWEARTDPAGHVALAYGAGAYVPRLSVKAPGFATLHVHESLGDGAREFRLFAETRLAGRVVDEAGVPVAGVEVVLAQVYGERESVSSVRVRQVSDARGRFAFPDLTTGKYVLYARGAGWVSPELGRARAGGFNPLRVDLASAGRSDMELRVVRAATMAGRVVDSAGVPVSGVSVHARLADERSRGTPEPLIHSSPTVTTGADGTFAMQDLVEGLSWTAHVSGPEILPTDSRPLVLDADAEPVTLRVVRMDIARDLEVLVLDETDGTPIEDVAVRVVALGPRSWSHISGLSGTTDGAGRVVLRSLPTGPIGVFFRSKAAVVPQEPVVVPESDGPLSKLVQRLPRRHVIGGVLTFIPDGVPPHGVSAEVKVRRIGDPEPGGFPAHVRMRYNPSPWSLGPLEAGEYELTFDVNGRKVKGVFKTGTSDARLELEYPWKRKSESPEASPASGDRVHYIVTGPDGSQPDRVRVASWTASRKSTSTHQGGEWKVVYTPAAWPQVMEVYGARDVRGDRLALGAVVLPFAKRVGEVAIRLGPEKIVAGRVMVGGEPAKKGTRVEARVQVVIEGKTRVSKTVQSVAMTDADGRFRLRGLGPYRYALLLKGEALLPASEPTVVEAGTQDVVVEARASRSATLTLVDEGGKPLAGIRVRVLPQDREPDPFGEDTRSTDSRGRVVLAGLDPDAPYALRVLASLSDHSVFGVARENWRPRDETIRLDRAYQITGRIEDLEGHPFSKVAIYAKQTNRGRTSWEHIAQVTDGGTFTAYGLRAGAYTIAARGKAHRSEAVSVRAGEEEVVLVVDRGIDFTVLMPALDAAGSSKRSFHYQALDEEGKRVDSGRHAAANDAAGVMTLTDCPREATWQFLVRGLPEGRLGWLAGAQPRGGEALRVPVVEGQVLTGTVQAREGIPTSQLAVVVRLAGTQWRVPVGEDGTFRVEGLPLAEVELTPEQRRPGFGYSGARVRAKPGDEVVLKLP